MNRIILVALGVIKKDNKFLLGLRYQPSSALLHHKWEFPGGEVEFNESLEEAVVREVREEVGVKVKVVSLISYVKTYIRERKDFKLKIVIFPYLCQIIEGEPYSSNNETEKVAWFRLREIIASQCLPGTKAIIENVLKLDNNA